MVVGSTDNQCGLRGLPVLKHPTTDEQDWGGRLPLAETGPLDDKQRALAERLHELSVPWAEQAGFAATTDDGYLIGPWSLLTHQPGPGRAFNDWIRADREATSLPGPVRESIILTIAVAWQADYELYSHKAIARHVGMSEPVIEGLLNHEPNDDFSAAELAAHTFTDELVRSRRVSETTYRRALEEFGQTGVIDMVHLIGIYLAMAALLNAFEIPAPE